MSSWRVGGRAHQRVAGGVDADRIHQVVERDDGARALRHADRLAVLDQVHQLADQDLEVHVRDVAERLHHRHHAADVAVVVGAEHDDVLLEAALALVEVVAEVARDVGGLAVGADDDAVAVVAERRSCAARSRRPPRRCGRARGGARWRARRRRDSCSESSWKYTSKSTPNVVQAVLDLLEHQLRRRRERNISCCCSRGRAARSLPCALARRRPGRRSRRCRRRRSRPPGVGSPR